MQKKSKPAEFFKEVSGFFPIEIFLICKAEKFSVHLVCSLFRKQPFGKIPTARLPVCTDTDCHFFLQVEYRFKRKFRSFGYLLKRNSHSDEIPCVLQGSITFSFCNAYCNAGFLSLIEPVAVVCFLVKFCKAHV